MQVIKESDEHDEFAKILNDKHLPDKAHLQPSKHTDKLWEHIQKERIGTLGQSDREIVNEVFIKKAPQENNFDADI